MALQEEMQTASPPSSDALPTPGGDIAQHQDLSKDVTIKGPGDSEVHTENDGMFHSHEPHGAAVTRQFQEC